MYAENCSVIKLDIYIFKFLPFELIKIILQMSEISELTVNSTKHESNQNNRHWESVGFAISKLVLSEGDMSQSSPRVGCTGTFEIKTSSISVTGIDWQKINQCLELSRYYNSNHFMNSVDSCKDISYGQFRIGHGDTDLDRLLEELLCSMYPGEKSESSFRICIDLHQHPHLSNVFDSYLEKTSEKESRQHWLTLQFVLTLIPDGMKNKSQIYLWSLDEKMNEASEQYESAVKLFKVRRYYDAFVFFRKAITLCQFIIISRSKNNSEEASLQNVSDEVKEVKADLFEKAELLKEKCVSNITACHFQWSNHKHVIFLATEGLQRTDNKSQENTPDTNLKIKMLYRRGVSNATLNNYDEAITDLTKLLSIEPSNKAAQQKLKEVKAKRQNSDIKMSNAMKKLFQSK